jgi:phosphoribosylformylglycinamidine synthase
VDRELLVALQDLGAAGLTSSAPEMAAKGGVGMDIDLDQVPLREKDMDPREIVISESQERMLAIAEPDRLAEVHETCERWQTGAAAIGVITSGDRIRISAGGTDVADLPLAALVDDAPAYDLDPREPAGWMYGNEDVLDQRRQDAVKRTQSGDPGGPSSILLALLASPSIASKRWAFEQYDSIVGSRTVRRPGSADAAVLQIDGGPHGIAISIDGNGRRVACDPYLGSVEAVLEGVQNLACVGAAPLGLTDCLNFGSPERGDVAWQLDRAIQGIADACTELGIPIVGGNVSLYNEFESDPIYPTPVVGLLGELPDVGLAGTVSLESGDAIALVGPFVPALAGSELAKLRGELQPGLEDFDLHEAAAATTLVRNAVQAGKIQRAHDISDGGLTVAIAELAIAGGVGVSIDLAALIEGRPASSEAWLFGEGPGGFVIAGSPKQVETLTAASATGAVMLIGTAGGDRIEIDAGGERVEVALADASASWDSLAARMESQAA